MAWKSEIVDGQKAARPGSQETSEEAAIVQVGATEGNSLAVAKATEGRKQIH